MAGHEGCEESGPDLSASIAREDTDKVKVSVVRCPIILYDMRDWSGELNGRSVTIDMQRRSCSTLS